MKKIILSVMLMGFVVAVQAADDKACADKQAGCCAKAKAAAEAKGECPMSKQAKQGTCPFAAKAAAEKQAAAKQVVQSPKAAGEASK